MHPLLGLLGFAFFACLAFYQPQRQSLRDIAQISLVQRLILSKGTLLLGLLLIAIAMFSFNAQGTEILPAFAVLFGYSRDAFFNHHLYYQPLSNIFFHFNLVHLVANASTLLLTSAYERRVGFLRYAKVFLLSGIVGSLMDIVLIPPGVISLGASGGISGLAAGYMLDSKGVSTREWLKSSFFVILFILFTSFLPHSGQSSEPYSVNWVAHLMGAVSAALYVRFF